MQPVQPRETMRQGLVRQFRVEIQNIFAILADFAPRHANGNVPQGIVTLLVDKIRSAISLYINPLRVVENTQLYFLWTAFLNYFGDGRGAPNSWASAVYVLGQFKSALIHYT